MALPLQLLDRRTLFVCPFINRWICLLTPALIGRAHAGALQAMGLPVIATNWSGLPPIIAYDIPLVAFPLHDIR